MRRSRLGLGVVVSLAALLAACGASSTIPVGTDSAAAVELVGVYDTNEPGAITQLAFVDGAHVNVTWADCGGGQSCTSEDTYVLNAAATELELTEPGGKVNTLSISGLVTGPAAADEPLHVLGGSNLNGSSGQVGGGTGQVGGSPGGIGGAPSTVAATPQQLAKAFAVQLANGCKQLLRASGTFPNDQTVYDFLLSKGLTPVQAAGVVGNLDQESGDSPTCYQGQGACSSTPIAGLPGVGIAQWGTGQRWDTASMDNMLWYAKMSGQSPFALQTQLNFMWYELSTIPKYGLAQLQQATTVPAAATAFAGGFESCGKCDGTKRNAYGQTAYNAFAGDAPDASASNGDGGMCTSYGSCTNAGLPGSCIDSMTCAGKGGMPSGGHCPGPSNIECCTET